jgi:PTH1 family peptidyl-tRNA hydrolase
MTDAYAIVGLGNPGSRYDLTRHNVGFMCVDQFSQTHGLLWKDDPKRECILASGVVLRQKIFVVKPQTYMNLSGRTVKKLSDYYDIPLENILVILDDLALPFGKIRFRKSGSAGSHNGLISIIGDMQSDSFPRLRIGIGDPPPEWQGKDYVLGKFSKDELEKMPKIIGACTQGLETFLTQGVETAMNQCNAWALESAS